jgi:mRNA-degrading endonuclease RelE of RelBE toxin-antitoxin system
MKVELTPHFKREAKRLIKKYHSLAFEIQELIHDLDQNPFQGEPLGRDCYKVRVAIASKGKGKSGGGRVITCVKVTAGKVTLLSIYDKSEQEDIEDGLLRRLLKENNLL